jgi:bifunctional oligoribonuclease and PAP phosphatase NrnA
MYDSREAASFIGSHSSFLVLGHKEPDGDCVASQLAVASLLATLGKSATVHSAGPFDRPEISAFEDRFTSTIPDSRMAGAAAIIVDCSTPDRIGPLGGRIAGLPCLLIDHHASGEAFGSSRYVDAAAPSTTMLVQQLMDDMGVTPDAEASRLLLFGLCTDTGFFRHLAVNGPDTFRAVARLVDLGTSTAEVYMMVYGRRELASRKLLGEMLARVESHWGDRLLVTWQTVEDRDRLAVAQRGEDDLYRLLQTIKGNIVVAHIKEEREGAYSVGLRSNTTLNVGAIAASFGGGGHKQAAGFDIAGTLDSVRNALLDTFAPLLSER